MWSFSSDRNVLKMQTGKTRRDLFCREVLCSAMWVFMNWTVWILSLDCHGIFLECDFYVAARWTIVPAVANLVHGAVSIYDSVAVGCSAAYMPSSCLRKAHLLAWGTGRCAALNWPQDCLAYFGFVVALAQCSHRAVFVDILSLWKNGHSHYVACLLHQVLLYMPYMLFWYVNVCWVWYAGSWISRVLCCCLHRRRWRLLIGWVKISLSSGIFKGGGGTGWSSPLRDAKFVCLLLNNVRFGQLILSKIFKVVATRCYRF